MRYDSNAHVNAVTEESNVFSHEQVSGPKNASSIMELIILDHLLSCKGEGVKVVVSDNASVGKNWLTATALPQCFVDQGLCNIFLMIYLENNHGKRLADMLFGQLQTRRIRSTLLSIDDLLSAFEKINRKFGKVQSFVINPLSSIDFFTVLETLGYQTKPPPPFGFNKRNTHFSAACRPGAKKGLPVELQTVFGDMLPNDPGIVRVSSSPPRAYS